MSKKTFIITLGWTEAPALSSLTKYGLGEEDKILVLTPNWKDKGTNATLASLKAIIEKISPRIIIEEIPIDVQSFENAIMQIYKIITKEEKNRKIIFNLSGGMRSLVIETFFAAMLSEMKDIQIELQSENRAFTIEIPPLSFRSLQLSKLEKDVLNSIKERSKCISEISKQEKKPLSSIHRAAMNLERKGLIKMVKNGRKRNLQLTIAGKLIAKIQE